MAEDFDSVRVVDEPTTIQIVNVSPRTWDRLKAIGDTPRVTKLSARRIGYRISDIKVWLDARRVSQCPSSAA
jgi:predicted DNA-binding transcriptional regulator AlpA